MAPLPKFLKQFGSKPFGGRLERIKESVHYRNGRFENIHETPQLTEGVSIRQVLMQFVFGKVRDKRPRGTIPSVKTNLHELPRNAALIWFGHSSYLLKAAGKTFLIDPVFSGAASPIPGMTKAFAGTDIYTAEDMPAIDYLIITHDHYDHLDYETVTKLLYKISRIVCGLGVGAHLEYWGFDARNITELDWYGRYESGDGITLHAMPARHFAGRTTERNNTLWMSYVLELHDITIYLGGDSGYDTHFAEIGDRFGPIDLAVLDCGQYDDKWKYIHMHPPETVQAAIDLQARRVLPVHSSKFALANHSWYDPLVKLTAIAIQQNVHLVTPKIGEVVNIGDADQEFTKWWEALAPDSYRV